MERRKRKMTKPYGQKLRLLYVMQILMANSDEEHPLSLEEIRCYLGGNGISAERKSIYDDIKALQEFGIDIENRRRKPSGYYVASRDFELPELKLLVDAVQSSKFITVKKSNELIRKIEALTSVNEAKYLQRQVYVGNRIKTMNENIYYNVDKIHTAISKNRKIRFHYYEWTPKKEMHLRREGEFYCISPWGLSWDDENYYMIGFDSLAGKVKHYRVDKMLDMEVLEEKRDGQQQFEKFDMASYARKIFGMFGGAEQNVKLICENELAGVMVDRFGKEVMMHPVDEKHFSIIARVNVSSQFYGWVLALGDGVVITEPVNVVEEFKGHVEKVLGRYR